MARFKFKLNERGVSLLELTVSIGIGGMVTLLLVSASKFLNRSQNNLQIALQEEVQTMLGDFFVTTDLLRAGQTFNVLGACRTAAGQDPGFYDYDPTAPGCDGVNPPAICSPKVRLTVDPGKNVSAQEAVFLITRKNIPAANGSVAAAMRTIHPNEIYTMSGPGPGNSSMTTTGALDIGDGSKLRAKLREFKMFDENAIIRFYSPYQGRRLLAGGNDFDYAIPPRNISVMGHVNGGLLVTTPPPFVECQASYDYDNIVRLDSDNPIGAFSRIDSFFRLLPSRTGLNAFAMIVQLEARRYKLYREGKGRDPFVLMAQTWSPKACGGASDCEAGLCLGGGACEPGSWRKRTTVLTGINRNFEFGRKNIRVPSFEYAKDVQ